MYESGVEEQRGRGCPWKGWRREWRLFWVLWAWASSTFVNVSDWHRDKYSLWFDVVLKCEQGNIYEGIRCDFIKFKEWDCYEDFIWNWTSRWSINVLTILILFWRTADIKNVQLPYLVFWWSSWLWKAYLHTQKSCEWISET